MSRRFKMIRTHDVSGVSGTGHIADGVEFEDGQTVLSWRGRYHSITIWPSAEAMVNVHGHEGRTRIEWVDEETAA